MKAPRALKTPPPPFQHPVYNTATEEPKIFLNPILYFDGKSWFRWQDPSAVTLRGVWQDPATGGAWIVGDKGIILHAGAATK